MHQNMHSLIWTSWRYSPHLLVTLEGSFQPTTWVGKSLSSKLLGYGTHKSNNNLSETKFVSEIWFYWRMQKIFRFNYDESIKLTRFSLISNASERSDACSTETGRRPGLPGCDWWMPVTGWAERSSATCWRSTSSSWIASSWLTATT